jgi:hypothetical protein
MKRVVFVGDRRLVFSFVPVYGFWLGFCVVPRTNRRSGLASF